MPTLRFLAAGSLIVLLGVAHAQTSTTAAKPLDQGISSVDKNLQRDPDNKGLQTASERLKRNQRRIEEQRAARDQRVDDARAQRFDRGAIPERSGRPGR